MDVRSIISKHFNENTFTGEEKIYKTTESIEATPHWGEWECIREFVQNALDEMTPEIKRDFEKVKKPKINEDFGVKSYIDGVYVWDRGRGVRVIDILITGLSRKAVEVKPTRGEFGEGIKKAVATLLRMGRKVRIYTRNGHEVIPEVGIFEAEGGKARVVQYRVRKYDTRMYLGTVVYIGTVGSYSARDFTTVAFGKPEVEIKKNLYIIRPECYNILPEELKIKMRGNEADVMDLNKIEKYCKEKGVENIYLIAIASDEIYRSASKFIAYRDIILRRNIKSLYSYNTWEFVPTDVMGRDRQIMSDDFLYSRVGAMYRGMSADRELRKIVPKEIMRNLLLVAIGKVVAAFESHIYFRGYMMKDEREYWRSILNELGLKNAVIMTDLEYDENIASILKYNGYHVIVVPSNFSRFADIYPIKEILKKLVKEMENKNKISDEKLDVYKRHVLQKLRWIVGNLWKDYRDDLRRIFDKYKEMAAIQRGYTPTFIDFPPEIYAYRYDMLNAIERGRKTGGHCDPEKGIIGISIEKLDPRRLYEALAVLNHELAHYVTWLTDADRETLREAVELVAGVVERALIEKYNRVTKGIFA